MLVINVADTDALQPLPEYDGDGEWPSADESQSERYQAFLQHLRGLTYTDGKLYEPIDMIRIDCTSYDMPGKNLWTALDGLQPKHLHIESGFDEECDLEPFGHAPAEVGFGDIVFGRFDRQYRVAQYLLRSESPYDDALLQRGLQPARPASCAPPFDHYRKRQPGYVHCALQI